MAEIRLKENYEPFASQKVFLSAPHKFKLFGGAVRGGKSQALCMHVVKLCRQYPGYRVFMGRKDLDDFVSTTLRTLLGDFMPGGGNKLGVLHRDLIKKWHQQRKFIELVTGSVIEYGELKDANSHRSRECGSFAFDEATETPRESFDMFVTRMSQSHVVVDGVKIKVPQFGLFASNPGPGWVKELFIDNPSDNFVFIPSLPSDNPYISKEYIETASSTLTEAARKSLIEGNWTDATGLVYKYSYDTHAISRGEFEDLYSKTPTPIYEAIDPGTGGITAVGFFTLTPSGDIVLFDEIYAQKTGVAEIAELIKLKELSIARIIDKSAERGIQPLIRFIDPSARAKNQNVIRGNSYDDGLTSIQDLYAMADINTVIAKNDILAGIERVNSYLSVDPNHLSPFTSTRNSPRFYVVAERCPNFVKEITSYSWEYVGTSKAVDHMMDVVRYFCLNRLRGDFSLPKQDSDHLAITRGQEFIKF